MSKKHDSNTKEIKNLRQKLKCYKDNGNIDGQSEILVQLGDEFRQMLRNEEALEYYVDAIKLAKKISKFENLAHCHRNIASILSEENDDEARKHVQLFLMYAQKLGSPNMIQLALHEYAFIYQGYASIDKEFLLEAFEKALQCKQYLVKHAGDIDNDKEAVKTAENSKRRMAGINSLLSEIFQCFGDYSSALKFNKMAVEYAQSTKDYGLLYNCLLMKIELTKGEDKVSLAKQRMEIAHQHLKNSTHEADLEYSKQILNFYPAQFDHLAPVLKILLKLRKNPKLSTVSKEYLVFIWKYEHRTCESHKTASSTERYKLYEKIADEAVNLKLYELALRFYEKMMGYSTTIRDKEKAMVSIAETLIDLGDFKQASEFYEKCLSLIKRHFEQDKITETEVSLAVTRSKDSLLSVGIRYKELKNLLNSNLRNEMELIVIEAIVMLLNVNRQQYSVTEIENWTNEWKVKKGLLKQQETNNDDGEDEEGNDDDECNEFDDVNETDMFYELEERFTKYEQRAMLEKKKNSRNTKGETLLHEAARDGDLVKVKQLIDCAYDVNAKDYGGWTPLSEAVNHGHLDVSRVLLQNGAVVDCQSGQALVNDDGTLCDSAGDTPLMEACANGHLDVARLLIAFKANVCRTNHNGFSALYFLNSYMENQDLNESLKRECKKLAKDIEDKQNKEGFKENTHPPMPTINPNTSSRTRCNSPVQIIDDIKTHKSSRKRGRESKSYNTPDAFCNDSHSSRLLDQSLEDDIHMDLNLYGVDVNRDHLSPTSSGERLRLREFVAETVTSKHSNRSRKTNEDNSSRPSRKRRGSPISISTSSSVKRSAAIKQTSVHSRSSRSDAERPIQRKKKRFAFSKRMFEIIDPLACEPVTMRRSFADNGVDIEEVINTIDQIFIRYN